MEKHYDHRTGKEYTRIGNSLIFSKDLSQQDKEKILKDAHSSIYAFNKLLYEVTSEHS